MIQYQFHTLIKLIVWNSQNLYKNCSTQRSKSGETFVKLEFNFVDGKVLLMSSAFCVKPIPERGWLPILNSDFDSYLKKHKRSIFLAKQNIMDRMFIFQDHNALRPRSLTNFHEFLTCSRTFAVFSTFEYTSQSGTHSHSDFSIDRL